MQFEVTVQLKREVLNPEARAIQETLARLGHTSLKAVTVSKRYVLEFADGEVQAGESRTSGADLSPVQQAETIAREYLANPVSETFQVKRL